MFVPSQRNRFQKKKFSSPPVKIYFFSKFMEIKHMETLETDERTYPYLTC